jgi:hypothetical protein
MRVEFRGKILEIPEKCENCIHFDSGIRIEGEWEEVKAKDPISGSQKVVWFPKEPAQYVENEPKCNLGKELKPCKDFSPMDGVINFAYLHVKKVLGEKCR